MKKALRKQREREREARLTVRPSGATPAPPPAPGPHKVLWVEPTGVKRYRRGYHCRACKAFTEEDMPAGAMAEYEAIMAPNYSWPEPRPTIRCQCGAEVAMNSAGLDSEYYAPSTGQVFERLRDLPPGAVWAARPWRDDRGLANWVSNLDENGRPFPEPAEGENKSCRLIERLHEHDGRVLICRLPDGHDWTIDSRANNCTLPLDDKHWCWNRSGRPEDGTLDVRKGKPGQTTCSAGGGSIQTGAWHGFLHDGQVRVNS